MAVEYGSEQERADDGNNAAVPRQQGTDVNLNYDVLPVPFSEVGSVDSAAFANAKVITLKEAALVLDVFVETSQARGIQVNDEVTRVRDYCQNFAPRRTDASEQIVRRMVAEKVTHPYYWALILNLSPENMDEFINLIQELDPRTRADGPFETEEQIAELVREMEAHRDGEF